MHLTSWTCGISIFLASLPMPLGAATGDAVPIVTLVEGKSTLVSGSHGYLPAPGVQLRQCDIVHTGPQAMVQLEFQDGSRIELGPETRFLSDLPYAIGQDAVVGPHFLRLGWVKITVPKRDNAPPHRINTPYFDLVMESGVAVLHIADGGGFFVEEGKALALDPSGSPAARLSVSTGQTYLRKSAQVKATVTDGADPTLVKAMPPSFRDTVPALLAKVKGRSVQPKPAPEYNYAEVQEWQKTDPELRQCLSSGLVRSAQETLQREGFDVGPIDGVLGPRTQGALREFQQQRGLTRSGQLDEETLRALNPR